MLRGCRTTDCLGGTARVAHACTFAVACTGTDLMSRTTIPISPAVAYANVASGNEREHIAFSDKTEFFGGGF